MTSRSDAELGCDEIAIADTIGIGTKDAGVTVIDASAPGICPFSPGASGNLATEDRVYMLYGLGVRTGVDLDPAAAAGRMGCADLHVAPRLRAASALISRVNPGRGSCSMAD